MSGQPVVAPDHHSSTSGENGDHAHERIPILVGITGKRRFDGDPQRNTEIVGTFGDRFRALIERLDTDPNLLPDTPKVLLCGGAAGTDLAAVRVVLEKDGDRDLHPAWSVVIMLPFDQTLFEQDFRDPPFDADLQYLRELCAGHERVIVKRMRALHTCEFDDRRLEPESAARFSHESLTKPPPPGHDLTRARHFEQLGLWIARYSTLLVAVSPTQEETEGSPHRLGGTARVIAYRRTATPDHKAEYVIARSSELLSNSPFEEPDGGFVLWIDPTDETPGECDGVPGLRVLRPIQQVADLRKVAPGLRKVRDAIYRAPMIDESTEPILRTAWPFGRRENRLSGRFLSALALARVTQQIYERDGRTGQTRVVGPALGSDEHPAAFLTRVRDDDSSPIKKQQVLAADQTRAGQRWCAFLFIIAIGSYESYTELAQNHVLPLILYVCLLLSIAAIASFVSHTNTQVRAEDLRGLREMIRVQIAWWSAGIDRMVDRVHLRTIDTDLRFIREMAAMISMWATLRCKPLDTCWIDPARLQMPNVVGDCRSWISGQLNYYERESVAQANAHILVGDVFRMTFGASMSALIVLLIVCHLFPTALSALAVYDWAAGLVAWPILAVILACSIWFQITRLPFGIDESSVYHPRWRLPIPLIFAMVVLASLLLGIEAVRRIHSCTVSSPSLQATLTWGGPIGFFVSIGLLTKQRIPSRARNFNVLKLSGLKIAIGICLLTALVVAGSVAFAPTIDRNGVVTGEAFRALVLVQSVLLLSSTGMLRWYSERRNHLAQAGHYADMLRAFARAHDWIGQYMDPDPGVGRPFDREIQESLVELGELALDEDEAWLRAHRERPAEPITG